MLLVIEAVERIGHLAEVTHSKRGLAARVDSKDEADTVVEKLEVVIRDRPDFEIAVQEMRDHYTIIMEKRQTEGLTSFIT